MRYGFLVLWLLTGVPVLAWTAYAQPAAHQGVLIKEVEIEGFVLGDKDIFVKLFKPYRNKYLTADDMDGLLHQLQKIYEQEGYQQLVAIAYQVNKHRLVFTVSMTS